MATSGDFYHRRPDRDPEQADFFRLPGTDRELISRLRAARQAAMEKVTGLEDRLVQRDRQVAQETRRREQAERKVHQLVDMYGEGVRDELHDKLPRAGSGRDAAADAEDAVLPAADDVTNADVTQAGKQPPKRRRQDKQDAINSEGGPAEVGYPPAGLPYMYPAPLAPYSVFTYPMQGTIPMATAMQQTPVGATAASTAAPQAAPAEAPPGDTSAKPHSGRTVDVVEASRNDGYRRQVSLLLTELDASRMREERLRGDLDQAQRDLAAARLSAETCCAEQEVAGPDRVADLVTEVREAQKLREAAMLGRLQAATQGRDEALLRAQRLAEVPLLPDTDEAAPPEIDGLLRQMEKVSDPAELRRRGAALVRALGARRQAARDVTQQEMRAVLQERDQAQGQQRRLAGDLREERRGRRAVEKNEAADRELRAQLLTTQRERDDALQRVGTLEEELNTLRVYYSLHKSLSQERVLREEFNTQLGQAHARAQEKDQLADRALQESGALLEQLQAALRQKEDLETRLAHAQRAQEEQRADTDRLERLVGVLRKKISVASVKANV